MRAELVFVQTKTCIMCKENGSIAVPKDGLLAWNSGEPIQTALPELSRSEREMLISGTHAKCWDEMWEVLDDMEEGE